MAEEPEAEVKDLETTEIEEHEEDGSEENQTSEETASEEPAEELAISFDDEEDPDADQEGDSPAIRAIRARNRELNKRAREAERRAAELEASRATTPKIEVGPKPDLWEDCEGDQDKFEAALDEWKAKKAKADEQEEKAQEKNRRIQDAYTNDVNAYQARKAELRISDDDLAPVTAALTLEQQAVAIQAANDPAALAVALSKSPARLAELAKIDNPWKLAAAIARMEGKVKVQTNKKAPAPNRAERGSASISDSAGGLQAKIDKLEAAWEKAGGTGDRTEIQRLKRELRERQGK